MGATKMYILEKRILGTQITMLGFYFFFGNLKNYHYVFHYGAQTRPKKLVRSSQNAENDQNHFPTWCTSHVRTNAREILLNTHVVFWGARKIDQMDN